MIKNDWSRREFLKTAGRCWEFWMTKLPAGPRPRDLSEASPERFAEVVQKTIEEEQRVAAIVPDPAPVRAIQKAILEGLRAGKSFRTAHKEGGTIIYFGEGKFRRHDYGDYPDDKEFDEAGLLQAVWDFYEWESRQGTYPHSPPDAERWKFIQYKLM